MKQLGYLKLRIMGIITWKFLMVVNLPLLRKACSQTEFRKGWVFCCGQEILTSSIMQSTSKNEELGKHE